MDRGSAVVKSTQNAMSILKQLTRSRHIHDDVGDRFRKFIPAGRILDLPAGEGVNALQLRRCGFEAMAANLFADRSRRQLHLFRSCLAEAQSACRFITAIPFPAAAAISFWAF